MNHVAQGAENRRQAVLDSYGILDTPDEKPFDEIARLAALICNTPAALISFMDRDRQWFKARYGCEMRETPRHQSFCAHAIQTPDRVMIVPDAASDLRFAQNPLVTNAPYVRFYAGAPMISPEGEALGTICAIDQTPRQLTPAQIEGLEMLAPRAVAQLDLRRSRAEMMSAHEKLELLTLTDAPTNIPNRRAFNLRIAEEEARAQRSGEPLSVLLADVDGLNAYNESFGHPAGDEALRALAGMLNASARPSDFVARFGGGQFAIILPATNLEGALAVAQRFCHRAACMDIAHHPLRLSIGAAWLSPGLNAADLLRAADRALHAAKARGRNCVAV